MFAASRLLSTYPQEKCSSAAWTRGAAGRKSPLASLSSDSLPQRDQLQKGPSVRITRNDFSVFMRIVKSKFFLSDVLDTEHEIHFIPLDAKRVLQPRLQYPRRRGDRSRHTPRARTPRRQGSRSVVAIVRLLVLRRALLSPIIHGLRAESLRKGLESTRSAVLKSP
jgi:hypothetical protein